MRFIHTSDWHIGHRLYGKNRLSEFARFLDWLAEYIEQHPIDALLVAGDIFDTTTPGNKSLKLYYQFLHRISTGACRNVVIIGGNHDSPTLLEAPRQLLSQFNVHVIGAPSTEPNDQVIPLYNASGEIGMVVCAAPFLRDRDIRTAAPGEHLEEKSQKLQQGILDHYQRLCSAGKAFIKQQKKLIPLVAMGHLLTTGASTRTGDGVRELYIGGLGRLEADLFPSDIDYFALGHIHLAQKIGGKSHIRYCGAPLPMGFNEAGQRKIILDVQLNDNEFEVEPITVPVFQRLEVVEGDLSKLLTELAKLVQQDADIWLEVRCTENIEAGRLREQLFSATENTRLEILLTRTTHTASHSLCSKELTESLDDLGIDEVFDRRLTLTDYSSEQCDNLRLAFQEIVTGLQQEDTLEKQ